MEITHKKVEHTDMEKMYERYDIAIKTILDAIWDLDIESGEVYRSESFCEMTGYNASDIIATLDWFSERIHPHDRAGFKAHIDHCLGNTVTIWEYEYRFQIANGDYRYYLDKAYAIYKKGRPVRVIGTMRDITDRKNLEAKLLSEQVQKQKMVNRATIKAQEKERNRISGELHDNVNQLLICAKMHISLAQKKGQGHAKLLDKANEYLALAVEDIRSLTQRLTNTVINNVGLRPSIEDIASTILLLKNIHLSANISDEVVAKLSGEQQLMVYRIIQEQISNILKHAETKEVYIHLTEENYHVQLIILDHGKGFDKSEQKTKGIGFINIFNRVDSYNGTLDIISSPGNGCKLIVTFPIKDDNQ